MNVRLLIIFLLCNTKNIYSQIGDKEYYIDTINHIIYHYYEIFPYENYRERFFNTIVFPEIINPKEKTYTLSDTLFSDTEQLRSIQLPEELPDSLFDILYMQNIINQWPLYDTTDYVNYIDINDGGDMIIPDGVELPYKNKDDYLLKEKANFKMYFLGNIKLNTNYTSKLILINKNNQFENLKRLFLLNIKDNHVRCISQILECRVAACDCYCDVDLNLKILGGGKFSLVGGISEAKHTSDEYLKMYDCYPDFFYDDDGYLQILKDCYNTPLIKH